jgi:iron complex transport system ATP-binding protein
MTDPLLEVEGLRFGPGAVALTGPAGFRVDDGTILVVLGPNGAGKTTLFRTLLGLIPPVSGRVAWRGRPLQQLAPRDLARLVAYVPQSPGTAFDFTVEEYVLLGRLGQLSAVSAPGRRDRDAAAAAIERLGLAAMRTRPLSRMSGGERQLAALARALAQEAAALVLDEPAASLDLANQSRVLDMLATLADGGLAIAYSTHDPNHALRAGTSVLLVSRGGDPRFGRVDAMIQPAELSRAYGTAIEEARTASGRRVVTTSR